MAAKGGVGSTPSISFQRAVDKFTNKLSDEQRDKFAVCKLEHVRDAIEMIQKKHGDQKNLRNMARIQAFLEAMEQYGRVVEVFLNSTIFLGYVWGPIKFILQVASTWVESLDILLEAYEEIGERIPSFMQYQALFDKNKEMQDALVRYYCDILEFHHNAIQFLTRPMWKKLFHSSWRTFNTQFKRILDSLARHKDLLESEKSTVTVMEVQTLRTFAESRFNEMESRFNDMAKEEKRRRLESVINKINPPNCHTDQNAASEQRENTQSGKWLLGNDHFRAWCNVNIDSNPLLYIHGIPGAGKTTLASLIIDKLLEEKNPVLFFYCKHQQQEKSTFTGILRGLLAQILPKDEALVSWFSEKCASLDRGRLESSKILEEFAEMAFNSQRISLVILDGLDECKHEEAEKAISWFVSRQKEASQMRNSQIRLLCIGQRTDTLQTMLSSAVSISLDNQDHQEDIYRYVLRKANRIREKFNIDSEVKSQMVSRVTNTARGMFLYAKLVMENLLRQITRRDLMKELEPHTFPQGLEAAYARVISTVLVNVPQKQREVASKIIGWVTCANRPLKWREIQATFFIDHTNGASAYEDDKLREGCKWFCGSLVDLQSAASEPATEAIINLVHETARCYLVQTGVINLSIQHAKMAVFCTGYLLSAPFNLLIQDDEIRQYAISGYYAFQDYAALNWFDHLISSTESSPVGGLDIFGELPQSVNSFLKAYGIPSKLKEYIKDNAIDNLTEFSRRLPEDLRTRTELFDLEWRLSRIRSIVEELRDEGGSKEVNRALLQEFYGMKRFKCPRIWCNDFTGGFDTKLARDEHVNRHERPFRCTDEYCPFHELGFDKEATLKRHVAQNHPSADSNGFEFPQPRNSKEDTICTAAARGDAAAVKCFLEAGTNIHQTAIPKSGKTPLLLAAKYGHIRVCELLLVNGADVNFKGPKGSAEITALHAAVEAGEEEVVRYLLTVNGIMPDEQTKGGINSLHIAAKSGHWQIFKMLLETGKFDIEAQGSARWFPGSYRSLRTPLMIAVERGDDKIVQILLKEPNVKADVENEEGNTPLHIAAANGNEVIVKWLLTTGKVDPDSKNKSGETPLHSGIRGGHEAIANMLLAIDRVDPDSKNEFGETPLHSAIHGEHEAIVNMLLATGRVDGETQLHSAVDSGHKAIVNMLLATSKVDLDSKNESGETPLHSAIRRGHDAIVNMLLATNRVDLNSKNESGETPLHIAAGGGHNAIVNKLLATGRVDPDSKNESGETPLHIAARGHDLIVNILLATGRVVLDSKNESGETPLHIAAGGGHEAIVNILLATGRVNPDSKNESGKTPVHSAAHGGHMAIVNTLTRNRTTASGTRPP